MDSEVDLMAVLEMRGVVLWSMRSKTDPREKGGGDIAKSGNYRWEKEPHFEFELHVSRW